MICNSAKKRQSYVPEKKIWVEFKKTNRKLLKQI